MVAPLPAAAQVAASDQANLQALICTPPLPTDLSCFLPQFRLYEVVSLHMCVLRYNYRKQMENVGETDEIVRKNGVQAHTAGGTSAGSHAPPHTSSP